VWQGPLGPYRPQLVQQKKEDNQMAQHSKAYRQVADKIDKDNLYTPLQATTLAKESGSTKYDSTVDVSMRLGVDPRKADQMVRGTVNLPHGTGKTSRVLVFATGANADAAREAGADFVGADELVDKVNEGWLDFDAVVATPDMMGKVGRLGRVLGPRNLMPNPKTGTVTTDVAKAVSDIQGGKIEFRVDRHSNLHFVIGKASFSAEQLADNYGAALDEVLRLKPASSKGRYVRKITVSTTNGPGVPVDPSRTKSYSNDNEA
jgi:large subunit ribosomal protein L1